MPEIPEAERIEAERLRQLRALIEDQLREFDVCAHVTLAGRHGRFENFTHVEATWSNLHWEMHPGAPGPFLRLRSQGVDYGGDLERQRRDLADSVGVVAGLAEMLASTAIPLLEVAQVFDRKTGATHTAWRPDDPRKGR
jgi:hypothetical protein